MGPDNLPGRLGYTPESHAIKPRNIASNEIRQRDAQYAYNGINSEQEL